MHVLVFSWFFPPYLSAGASRMGQLTKHLVRSGVRVSVVTGRPNDLPAMSDIETGAEIHYAGNVDLNALPRMVMGRRDVVEHGYELSRLGRFRSLGMAYKQFVHLPDAQAGWIAQAARVASGVDRPDVVLSSSPPASAHLAAARFALPRGIPWVAEYRSPWTDTLYFRRWWPARPLERAVERWIGHRASAVTAISAFLQDRLTRTLGRPVEHVPNGFDPDDYHGDVTPEPGLFVHLGTVYAPYPTQDLINALRLVRRPHRVVFLGRNLANLPQQLEAGGAEHLIERPGPVPRGEAIRWIRRAEANLLFLTHGPGSPDFTDVPQKMYEYFAARRPIVAIGPTSSETAGDLRRSGLAAFADAPEALARCLEDVPPVAASEAEIALYDYDRIAARFRTIFETVA